MLPVNALLSEEKQCFLNLQSQTRCLRWDCPERQNTVNQQYQRVETEKSEDKNRQTIYQYRDRRRPGCELYTQVQPNSSKN